MGRGTSRRWRWELGRLSPARRPCGDVAVGASRSITGLRREVDGCWVGVGGGRTTARADGTTQPAVREGPLLRSCVTYREGPVSATSWLGPPSRIQSENYSERSTGRPRPIPDVGSMRSMTRSTAGTSWSWAWESVRANKGAAGIDRQTIADVEQYGIAKLFDELAADLKDGSYRPLAARRVFIPKPGRPTEQRPLSIPTVTTYHKVVQAVCGFAGRHASVSSAARRAPCGAVRSSCRGQSYLRVRGRAAGQRGAG